MSYWRWLILMCLAQCVACGYLRDNEKLIKVHSIDATHKSENYVLDFIGLAASHGYPAEEHNVTTKDGYNIKLHRIFGAPSCSESKGKPVIFVMHGLSASSDVWVLFDRSLGYMLADAGYDVWLGNARGNCYGRSHQTLSPEAPEFWNFSYHETGVMDIPAMIDYTLNYTGESSLTYIGHSMGGTAGFVLFSTLPEYNNKTNVIISLAGPAFWKKKNHIRTISKNLFPICQLFNPTGMSEAFPQSKLITMFANSFLKNGLVDLFISPLEVIFGSDAAQLNKSELADVWDYYPAGSSFKPFWHYGQGLTTGKFRQYDYGSDSKNLQHYGKVQPPDYNVSNISAPMVLYFSQNDPMYSELDAKEMARRVGGNVQLVKMPWRRFGHLDIVVAIDVRDKLYTRVLETIKEHNKADDCKLNSENSKTNRN